MIVPHHIAGKKYVVLGLGKSGLATAQSLMAGGAKIQAWDDSDATREQALVRNIPLVGPKAIVWDNVTALVMSPGIPHNLPAPHPIAAAAKKAGIPLIGDIELLFQAQPEARYIGITGTNGKSTTTALIGHILRQAGIPAQIGGNLGTPVLSFEPLGTNGVYVLELSSYQLELIADNHIDIAIHLNLTPDHLDRHGDMQGYAAAKARIVQEKKPQIFICGVDDAPSRTIADQAQSKPHITVHKISQQDCSTCSVYASGAYIIDNFTGTKTPVLDLSALPRLPGLHNRQNIAAAYTAARALEIPLERIIAGIQSFPGLEHRQQLVATFGNVRYVNDSKATNAEAAAKALVCYDNIYWILGGQAKTGGLQGLEEFMPRIRHAFLIGEASDIFAAWLDGKAPYTRCGTLEAAVKAAVIAAEKGKQPGTTVLLSPACASWDQFRNFEHRGNAFIDLVKNLHAARDATPTQGVA